MSVLACTKQLKDSRDSDSSLPNVKYTPGWSEKGDSSPEGKLGFSNFFQVKETSLATVEDF